MKREVLAGKTDYSVLVFIPDSASTDGSGKTGLVAANLTVSGTRMETDNDAVVTDYTSSLNDLGALTSAHNDWGLKEISNTLAPGLYRLDIADAIFASGAWTAVVYVMVTTSAAAASPMEFVIVAHDPDDLGTKQSGDSFALIGTPAVSVSADIAAVKVDTAATKVKTDFLPSATAGAAGGLFIAGTNAATTITTSLTTTFTGNLTGSVGSVTGAVGSVTGAVGSVTGAVGSVSAGGIAAASFAAGAMNAAAIANGAIDAATFAANALDAVWSTAARLLTAGTNIVLAKGTGVTGFNDLSAADVRTAVGLGSANLDTQLDALPTAAENADAVWDEAIAGHLGAGSTGEALDNAGAAGTPPTVSEIADEVQTRTIAAVTLVNGLAANTVTASALATDAVTEIQSGLATSSAVSTLQTSVNDLPTNAELATALGTADDAVLTAIGDLPTNAELATALGTADDAVLAAIPTTAQIADKILGRSLAGGSDVSGTNARNVRNALRSLRNKSEIVAGTINVYEEDDTTLAWTGATTTAPGDPLTSIDPA